MVIEVDNTTKQLLSELQVGVNDTISDIHDGQNEIKNIIEGMRDSILDEYPEEFQKLKNSISGGNRNINNQLTETSENINELRELFNQSAEELSNTIDKGFDDTIGAEQLKEKLGDLEMNIEKLFLNSIVSKMDIIIEASNKYDKQLEKFSEQVNQDIGGLLELNNNISTIETNNKKKLEAIVNYLSLPGYKRFFKGMEMENDEDK